MPPHTLPLVSPLKTGSNSWTKLDPTGPAPQGRTIQSIGKVHTDDSKGQTRLYLFGGGESGDTPVQDADVYCLDLSECTKGFLFAFVFMGN